MSDVRAAVFSFTPRSGTGTQTVTGVQDADGTFVGKVFIFNATYVSGLNTVTSGAAGTGAYSEIRGVDTGSIRSAYAVESLFTGFSFKAVTGGQSLGDDSIIDYWTTNLGSYSFDRSAKITAISDGQFTLTFTANFADPQKPILVTVLGGTDIDFTFTNVTNGTYTTPSKPQGLLAIPVPAPASSGATAGGVGGQNVPYGFATRDGVYGASALNVVNQGNNWSVQRTSAWNASMDDTTGALGALPTISAWGDTSFTIANGSAVGVAPMAISGALVKTAGGVFNQPIATGLQTIDLGMSAKVIWFFSIGRVAATTVNSVTGQFAMGTGTAQGQIGYWGGEATNGNSGPQTGARLLSADTVLRFGTPAAGSTTFVAVASLDSLNTDGTAVLYCTMVDSTTRQILWFAIGEDVPAPPTPTYHTRTLTRRRLRRAPIVWAEKDGLQTRVKVNLFAVDMQPGVGTADTPEPLVMVRASKDGGRTWGNERRVQVGRVGEYFKRLNTWQWGSGRQWVFEVSTSDPVIFNLVNAYIDAEPGTS